MKFWKDKTLRLSLRCKGWREIIHEVLHPDYLGEVKIIQPKELKDEFKNYIKNFKRHLALNIASMMQGYSGQEYKILESKIDSKNKVTLVDMEIFSETGSLIVLGG